MKKYKLIFLSALMLFLIFGTTSFARVEGEMTNEMAEYIFDYMFSGDILKDEGLHSASTMTSNVISTSASSLSSIWTFYKSKFQSFNNSTMIYNFYTKFNDATKEINNSLGVENYVFVSCFNQKGNGNPYSLIDIYAIPVNNTNSDYLPYLSLYAHNRNESYGFYNIITAPYGSNTSNTKVIKFTLSTANNTVTYSDYGNFSKFYFLTVTQLFNGETKKQLLFEYKNSDTVLYTPYNFITLVNMPIYTNSDLTNTGTTNSARILKTFYVDTSSGGGIGGETSGDNSGDQGGSSVDLTITNEKIDQLNQHAEEIKNKIPTSGDIASATTQGNKDYWGNTEQMKGEDYENQINQGINDSMSEISEELEKNKIFNSIAIAEQKIIDLFLEKPEDFKISWQDVNYMDKKLIPAGEVNFSQMCRENETLGKVKNTLNIIVSAMISLSLFRYIFNLIMVTLGIDHPLVLETEKDDITEISRTKIGNKTYVTKKTYKSDKKGDR